ncbi:hypothetical protein CVS44_03820 [Staphylococcus haemolyticus]|nr:hypothetical protein CVS44_03820 [Staphylococcus haemolyticus]
MRLNQAFFKPSHPCLVGGALTREFLKEILPAKQVGVRGPSKENFLKKFYKLSKHGDTITDCP